MAKGLDVIRGTMVIRRTSTHFCTVENGSGISPAPDGTAATDSYACFEHRTPATVLIARSRETRRKSYPTVTDYVRELIDLFHL